MNRQPISRKQWLTPRLCLRGVAPWLMSEALYSVALSHPPGWLDELVDPDTGEAVAPLDIEGPEQ